VSPPRIGRSGGNDSAGADGAGRARQSDSAPGVDPTLDAAQVVTEFERIEAMSMVDK